MVTPSSSTSLQRAINDASKLKKFATTNRCGGGESFESTFAQGLNLSEFGISPSLSDVISKDNDDDDDDDDDDNDDYNGKKMPTILYQHKEQRSLYRSAAEELLKIKQKERGQQQIQEKEELKMQEALQKQLKTLNDNQTKDKTKNNTRSSFEVVDALVRMHDTDATITMLSSNKTNNNKTSRKGNRRRQQQQKKSRMSKNNYLKPSFQKKKRNTKF